MDGQLVGTWVVDRGSHRFTYDASWLASSKCRALSLSLPITPALEIRGQVVANYFDNLLPDDDRIRARLSRRFQTRSADAFSLLEAIGRDCAGAVQLLPEGMEPQGWDRIESEPLTEKQVADILRAVPSDVGAGAGSRRRRPVSHFAGRRAGEDRAALPRRAMAPTARCHATTHILKLPLGLIGGSRRVDFSDSVEDEWLCALILYPLGLPVARTEIWRFEDQKALAVHAIRSFVAGRRDAGSRGSRRRTSARRSVTPPRQKYEKDGGPGMAECMRLLTGSQDPGGRAALRDHPACASGSWPPPTATPRTIRSSCKPGMPSLRRRSMTCCRSSLTWATGRTSFAGAGQSWRSHCVRRTSSTTCTASRRGTGTDWPCSTAAWGYGAACSGWSSASRLRSRRSASCCPGLSRAHVARDLAGDARAGSALACRPRGLPG